MNPNRHRNNAKGLCQIFLTMVLLMPPGITWAAELVEPHGHTRGTFLYARGAKPLRSHPHFAFLPALLRAPRFGAAAAAKPWRSRAAHGRGLRRRRVKGLSSDASEDFFGVNETGHQGVDRGGEFRLLS